jgi:lipid-binding SYLF domain-containing protein
MKRLLLAALTAASLATPSLALADSPQHLVDSATLSVESMMGGSEGNQAQEYLRRAKAVVVCPNIFRGAFFVGGEGGGCVMLSRNDEGRWSYPAFYNMGSGSFGLQIGVQSAQVMMMIMTDNGLQALLSSQFKFGADAGLSVATLGAGVNGAMSTGLQADIISFSMSEGLYGGISLSGSVLSDDAGTDQSYYGSDLDARQIVIDQEGSNQGANPLREMLRQYGG